MINLLPKERIRQINAARQNTQLLRYVLATAITLGLAIAIHAATLGLLQSAENSNLVTSEENQKRVENYREVRKQSEEYVENLKIAKSVFDKRTPYTDAIAKIANTLPEGVILQNITLSPEFIGKPTTLTAKANSYESSIKLKDNFKNSNIAEDVSIILIGNQGDGEIVDSNYPFLVTINLTYTKELLKPLGGDQ
ncbi:hypothetical protein GX865_03100 [Candidatus Saccharibacteria bacterium]|jgi:Tfp pilus assembly protein PilN|nr:hypothetical protein [Candidatus Saccharibacteria bacterium]